MSFRSVHAVVPGTFDPITLGHLDVIRRATHLFDRVSVGVAASLHKNGRGTLFDLECRCHLVQAALLEAGLADCVDVYPMEGLLVDFCRSVSATAVVKGLRAMTDFEYEFQQADLNRHMDPHLESVYVMSGTGLGYVSSSVVRELASFGSDVSQLVPACVCEYLADYFSKKPQ